MYIKDRVSFFFSSLRFEKIAELSDFFFPPSACSVPERGGGGRKILYVLCSVKRRLASAVNLTRKEMSGPGE